eukprot:c420_g1_i1.p1 GENE.c420_g1_i1~~c420_g1_i1.p1  ORF type:complete len:246 (+),score=55.17 c420_g1_i1:75-812(+)
MDYVTIDPALLAKMLEYMATTAGRDKMCRTVQYLSNYLHTYYGPKDATAVRLKGLASALSMARKGFRMFKWLESYDQILKLDAEKDIVLRTTAGLKAVGFGLYLAYDNWIFLAKAGAIIDPALDAKVVLAYKFWFVGLICSLLRQAYQGYGLHRQRQAQLAANAGPSDALRKTDAAIHKLSIGVAKDLADMMLPLKQLGWGGPLCPSERFASFCGFLSSLIGAYQLWPADAAGGGGSGGGSSKSK